MHSFLLSIFTYITTILAIQIPLLPTDKNTHNAENKDFVQHLVDQMTLEELALQLDMYQGDLLSSHGQLESEENLQALLGKGRIMGTLHDFYAPVDVLNAMQEYALTKSRLKIPILVIEECLHGLLYDNRTVFPRRSFVLLLL